MKSFANKIVLLFVETLLFCSCIYNTDEISVREIRQPSPLSPSNVTLSIEDDSIVIYKETNITITVNSFGKKFNAAKVSLYGYNYILTDSISSFTISPSQQNEGEWMNLSIDYYYSTGSGSIADNIGVENYVGTRIWKIKYINLENYNFNFNHKIGSDSTLELYWIKPDKKFDISQTCVMYHFLNTRELKIIGQNKDTVFYQDPDYIGGSRSYILNIYDFSLWRSQDVNYSYPKMTLVDKNLHTLKIEWGETPFRIKYRVLQNDKEIYLGYGTSIVTPQIPISQTNNYILEFYPPSATVYGYAYREDYVSMYHSAGIDAYYGYCYVPNKDIFYLSRYSNYPDITSYGIPLPEDPLMYYKSTLRLLSNQSGNLKVGVNSYVNVYNENNQIIDMFDYKYNFQIEFLTVNDNNTIGYFDGTNYHIKNYGEDTSWKEFIFKPHYNDSTYWTYARGMNMTESGKYLACHGDFDFILYDVSDHQNAKPIFQSPHGHAIGNSLNYNELIWTNQSKIEVCSLPDMQILRQCDVSAYSHIILLNVDPYSHILTFSSQEYVVFINIDTMQEVYRVKTSYYLDDATRLYRKQLFTVYHKVIDMSSYLP